MSSTDTQDTSSSDMRQKTSKAVFVVGPSSSGKTTLCNALAAKVHLDPARHIEEVARTVMRTQGFSRHTVHTYEMQHAIMVAQAKEEQRVISMSIDATSRLQLLSDRSTIDPIVYASISGGPDAEEMRRRLLSEPAFLQVLPLYRRSLFVALAPIPEWIEDDGVRSLGDPPKYYSKLCELLAELGITFVEIGETVKSLTRRVEFVERHLLRDDI